MFEAACERGPPGGDQGCNVDQRSFKAYFSRWLAATTQLAPWTTDTIMPLLRTSALAAAQSCSGGTDGVTCGSKWWVLGWDGQYGVGEQMSALEVIQSSLVARVKGPLSNATGGTSKGDPSAGTGHEGPPPLHDLNPRDRKGAIALTVVLVLAMTGTAWYVFAVSEFCLRVLLTFCAGGWLCNADSRMETPFLVHILAGDRWKVSL